MSWRESHPGEAEQIVNMMLSLYTEDPAEVPITAEQGRRTLERLAAEPLRGRAVVWDDGRGPRGYALLCSFWSNELGGEVCIIDELYLEREARGRGAGTLLAQGLALGSLPWFRDAVAVELEVTPSNQRARALYERLGFAAYKNALMRRRR